MRTPSSAVEAARPLVGRSGELAAIEAALARISAHGEGHCLAAAGTLGLGKTRLLSELRARAEAVGALVLAAGGAEYEAGEPYGLAIDALEDYLGGLGPRDIARLGDGLTEELTFVFRVFGDRPERSGEEVRAGRHRTHRTLRALIGRLAERRPLVLVLDDLHWADAESIEVVGHLLRRPLPPRVLLVIAYRPAQMPGGLAGAIERGQRDGRCEVLKLDRLTEAEAGDLAAGLVEPPLRAGIVSESGGNPFFIEQLARAAGAGGHGRGAPAANGSDDEVPQAVKAALEGELSALEESERDLLRGGAVTGEPFEIDLAAAAAGMERKFALSALDALLARELVRPTESPLRFSFRHPLVRRAVYQAQGAGWRVAAHGRVAAALRDQGAPVARVADHVERSSAPGDEQAIATLVEAGQAVAQQAPATAARRFQAALDLLPEGDARRLELLVSLATALGSAGRLEDARSTLLDTIDAMPADAHDLRARAAIFVARIAQVLGRQGESRAMLESALADLPEPRSQAAVLLTLELVMDQLLVAELGPARIRARHALDLTRRLGDPLLEAAALATLSHVEQNLHDIPASLDAASSSGAILDELDDSECAPLLEAFWWLASAEDVLERWDDCLRHTERGMRLARAFGVEFVFIALGQTLSVTLGWQGMLTRARETALETVDAAHLSGSTASIAYAYTTQCFVHTRAGEAREAVQAGKLSVDSGRSLSEGLLVSLPHSNLAAALLEAGEPERARMQLEEARERGALEHWVGRCWWELWMCEAELALGRLDEADEWAGQAALTADEMGLPGRRASVQHARAGIRLARGDAAGAAELALDAAEALAACGRAVDAERSRILAGRGLAAAGEQERAIEELQAARAKLVEADAPGLADTAARELRKLGLRISRAGGQGTTTTGIGSLSAREHEIASRVETGETNREIATALHLSQKTVENHLSRVFRKLDISSRAALAGMIGRDGGD